MILLGKILLVLSIMAMLNVLNKEVLMKDRRFRNYYQEVKQSTYAQLKELHDEQFLEEN